MVKVLVHLAAGLVGLPVHALSFILLALFQPAVAQYLVNGQVYTSALAIVDGPAPNSTYHAGSNIPIALDVSGNGKLPQTAATPGSGLATGFDLLELYLISTQTNLTLSNGTGLLTQEPGSTVKHLNFALPNCVAAGEYNFTVYETSHINNQKFFSITPIPISVENTNFNGPCITGVNNLQDLPQPASPPSQNPLLNTTSLTPLDTSSHSGTNSLSGSIPVTVSSPLSTPTSTQVITLTIGPSGVIFPLPTPTSTPALSLTQNSTSTIAATGVTGSVPTSAAPPVTATVTVVLVSIDTITTTAPGQTSGFTTVITSVVTSTTLLQTGSGDSGFLPVNAAMSGHLPPSVILLGISILLMLLFS